MAKKKKNPYKRVRLDGRFYAPDGTFYEAGVYELPEEWDIPSTASVVPDDTPLTDEVEEDLENFAPSELSRASAAETRKMKKRIADLEAREAKRETATKADEEKTE